MVELSSVRKYIEKAYFPKSLEDLMRWYGAAHKEEILSNLKTLVESGELATGRHRARNCQVWWPASRKLPPHVVPD